MTLLRETLRPLPDAMFADVYESAEAYLVVLDVPGVTAEAVSVHGEGAFVELALSDQQVQSFSDLC